MQKTAYAVSAEEVASELGVNIERGLTSVDVGKRLEKFGPNVLKEKKKINPFELFFGQFEDFLIRILIVSGLVSVAIGVLERGSEGKEGIIDGILILIIVILVAVVGFLNEYKAEKTIEALKKLIALKAKVIRDGEEAEINAGELVPGDIVLLEEGEKVPADIRLIEVIQLQTIESSLTGESAPIFKKTDTIEGGVAIGDRKNMVFSSTTITSGKGKGIVVGTGSNTEIGRIATMVSEAEDEDTPMQKKLDRLGAVLGKGILWICAGVFVTLLFFVSEIAHKPLLSRISIAFIAAVALAVAAIPEGLAFVVRISMALGARRMAKRNALIRSLPAVEALGSTDVICSDKTGTLTKGEMTVRKVWVDGEMYDVTGTGYAAEGEVQKDGQKLDELGKLVMISRLAVLCNNARYKESKIIGDPTEGALLVAALKAGVGQRELMSSYPRVFEVPFTSDRKMMSVVHKSDGAFLVAAKGATEILLSHATKMLVEGHEVELTSELKEKVLAESEQMSKSALRVLLFAYKKMNELSKDPVLVESELVIAGLMGMIDPPRVEIKATIEQITKQAGIKVIMITGDHIETAKAVAAEIGIEGKAITGVELNALGEEEFEQAVDEIAIYARVNPEHKLRIVRALKKHGHQVAMTGDGVNDAPAIKAADIGIAMGISGTDVAKETADLILLDDNFQSIVNAVEEGRGIFDNVRKFVNYLLSCNIAEVLIVLFGSLLFGQLVLIPLQLLWINIVTDGLPAIALGSDPAEKGIMGYSPHRFQSDIVTKRLWIEMAIFGLGMAMAVLIPFGMQYKVNLEHAIAVAFTATVVLQMVRLIDLRSDYKIGWFSNFWVIGAVAMSLILQLIVGYTSGLSHFFHAGDVTKGDWFMVLLSGALLFLIMKITRRILDKLYPLELTQKDEPHAG